ncbi:MAG: CopD family protein [Gammaproteobacteria bacterium AqS3]|nr:CopD family protein [Gammaproteobacteria bacterium AqS3]
MLWLKAAHICFVVFWFAGLLYLPRLLVNFAETESPPIRSHLLQMQQRLYRRIMHLAGALTLGSGLWLLWLMPHTLRSSWMWGKLALVGGLVVCHGYLGRCIAQCERDELTHSGRFLRIFNEVPALLLIGVVLLVVLRPGVIS